MNSLRYGMAACLAAGAAGAVAQDATQRVEIIGTSPLPGQGIARDQLPYTTQLMRRSDIDRAQTEQLTDLLARRMPGVQVNDIQGSPFQGDLTFHGFRASGLLGAPQGMSVYLDGVRINEPFGDVVQWDLVPAFALDSMALVPAANPAFGLNTLGGAIALTTATGRSAPGWRAETSLGSFGRKRIDLSHGGSDGPWQHYLGIGAFDESGWRDHSPGDLTTVLGKLARSTDAGEFGLSVLWGRSSLTGNGLVPQFTFDDDLVRTPDLGALDRAAVYTHPDLSRSHLTQFSASWRYAIDADSTLEALAYTRRSRRETVNGDEAEEESPDEDANAVLNRSATRQNGRGLSFAWSSKSNNHQWQVGASVDHASVGYRQTEQDAVFDDTRGVRAGDEEPSFGADVQGSSTTVGLYATDTWRVAARTHVTGTLRFNRARVGNTLTTADDDTGDIEENPRETFVYRDWNPAIGVAHKAFDALTLFANVARNTRVPTVIELGCADPDSPCRLPAGLQADPYLKPVRSTSVEAGMRFGRPDGVHGSLTLFRTDNRDDIIFSSVSVTSQLGYFRNFERTRNQGLDLELARRWGRWDLGLAYSHLAATYEADGTLRVGERNVAVVPGTRIAGLPRHQLKLSADGPLGAAVPGVSVGADLQWLSRRVSAGNEDGRAEDDSSTPADFSVGGYALVNLRAGWRPHGRSAFEWFVRVNNVFDRRYDSFGALAATRFNADGSYNGDERDALFVAPGAPRAFYVGVRIRL